MISARLMRCIASLTTLPRSACDDELYSVEALTNMRYRAMVLQMWRRALPGKSYSQARQELYEAGERARLEKLAKKDREKQIQGARDRQQRLRY